MSRALKIAAIAIALLLGGAAATAWLKNRAPISPEECTSLARRVEEAVAREDMIALGRCLDEAALVARAIRGFPRDSTLERLEAGLAGDRWFALALVTKGRPPARYSFLRLREDERGPRPLFRLVQPDGSFNYHELILGRRDGAPRVVDVHVYATGEAMSETLHRMLLSSFEVSARVTSESDRAHLRAVANVNAFLKLHKQEKYEQALTSFGELPDELRRDKSWLLMRYRCAWEVGSPQERAAFDELARLFPDDPAVEFLALNAGRWGRADDAIAAVERLERRVGGDPYLCVVRAGIYETAGDSAKAAEWRKRAAAEGYPPR